MSERVRWLQYEGQRILAVNYSNIRDENVYLEALSEMETEVLKQPKGKKILTLLDFTNSLASPAINERSRRMTETAKKAGIPDSPTAVVGMIGFKKAIVQAMQFLRPDIYIAANEKDGIDWLLKQAK